MCGALGTERVSTRGSSPPPLSRQTALLCLLSDLPGLALARRAHTIVSALKIGTDRGNFQGPQEGADHFPGAPDYPRFVGDSNCAVSSLTQSPPA